MEALESKRREPELIYCASRLFAIQDRAAILRIANAISEAISDENIGVFLPFRDINQANIEGPDKARVIYNHDISTLKKTRIVVALVDGVSKDDGVAMELGYAFGLGIPFMLCSSDFIVAELESECNSYICDPLVDLLALRTVVETGLNSIKTLQYENAHIAAMDHFAAKIAAEVVEVLSLASKSTLIAKDALGINYTFIDIAGGRYAYSVEIQRIIAAGAPHVLFGSRWKNGCSTSALEVDLHSAMNAKRCIFFADSAEMDPGSAFLHGLAVSQNIPVSLFYSGPVILRGAGGQVMRRNLMLSESADSIFSTLSALMEFLA